MKSLLSVASAVELGAAGVATDMAAVFSTAKAVVIVFMFASDSLP